MYRILLHPTRGGDPGVTFSRISSLLRHFFTVAKWLGSPLLACGTLGVSPGNLSSSCLGPFALGDHFAIAPSSSSACAPHFWPTLFFASFLPPPFLHGVGTGWVLRSPGGHIAGSPDRRVFRSAGPQIAGSSSSASSSTSLSSSSFAWCLAHWATISLNASPPPPHGHHISR